MRGQPMVAAKTERLLNLVICLLYTRRPLTKGQIRRAVVQYAQTSDEAFDRMFERDKDELRELGVPLVTEHLDTYFEDEPAYRIDQREYALPEISFAPDELAVLQLAGRAWHQASLAGPAAQALRKLAAAGVERDESSLIGVEARVRTTEPSFDPVRRAVVDGYPIRFGYRRAGQTTASARHVQPWGLASWHGRWYLTGFDTDRAAARVFRLSRMDGPVVKDGPAGSVVAPEDHEPRAMIRTQAGHEGARPPVVAELLVREGAGHALRRRAEPAGSAEPAAHTEQEAAPPGWARLRVTGSDADTLADEVSGYGPDVIVVGPAALRAAVRRRLQGALDRHTRAAAPGGDQTGDEVSGPLPERGRT
ncbi:MAG TPA: WYL domain-containing protein [Dermatophilaceae bacterium]|nr:WYL domain-containing protein [Dermatophilaceae bacterium]